MISYFSKLLGVEFPWDKYHQIVVRDYISGAMENTGAVVFGDFVYKNDKETGTQGIEKLFSRVSFVCYLREKLEDCKEKDSLPYYKRIGYNPKTMTLDKKVKTQTRKKRKE